MPIQIVQVRWMLSWTSFVFILIVPLSFKWLETCQSLIYQRLGLSNCGLVRSQHFGKMLKPCLLESTTRAKWGLHLAVCSPVFSDFQNRRCQVLFLSFFFHPVLFLASSSRRRRRNHFKLRIPQQCLVKTWSCIHSTSTTWKYSVQADDNCLQKSMMVMSQT